MPNTFVMRQSALQDGTVLRSADTFAPGSDQHGTMVKASPSGVITELTEVTPSSSGVRSFTTDVINTQGMRRMPQGVTPNQTGVKRKPQKVEPIDG